MTKKADIGTKKLIGLNTQNWVKWIMGSSDIIAKEILSNDLEWISRNTDVIIKASNRQLGDFLIINELQLRYNNKMPNRMRAYAGLVAEKYDLPVYPLLINILRPTPGVVIESSYSSNVLGLVAHQEYRVINLWEVDVDLAFNEAIPTLLPFVPILKGGAQTEKILQAVQLIRANENLASLEQLLAFFASFVLSTKLVNQIVSWDMSILLESPWYQEMLEMAKKQANQAYEENMQRLLLAERLKGIKNMLECKFGQEGLDLHSSIFETTNLEVEKIPSKLDQLEEIVQTIKTVANIEELRQIIANSN